MRLEKRPAGLTLSLPLTHTRSRVRCKHPLSLHSISLHDGSFGASHGDGQPYKVLTGRGCSSTRQLSEKAERQCYREREEIGRLRCAMWIGMALGKLHARWKQLQVCRVQAVGRGTTCQRALGQRGKMAAAEQCVRNCMRVSRGWVPCDFSSRVSCCRARCKSRCRPRCTLGQVN